jgi:SAM-dependent methyltransferase
MPSALEHYENHLAPVYSWMAGGIESAITRGRTELTDLGLLDRSGGYAVDLGTGIGMHSIPLAKAGWSVLAIDCSTTLLQELRRSIDGAAIEPVQDDLLNFPRHLRRQPDIVLCMGDTLTHLRERLAVENLIAAVATHLGPGGQFIVTFRDYSRALEGATRFIAVRSDESRILTCFLEYEADTVLVHDMLHEAQDGVWDMRVSAYRKLRLEPSWVKARLESCGFAVEVGAGLSGMVRLCATRV